MSGVIHVAVATDRDYVLPLAAMLASLPERVDPARRLVVHLLGDRLTEALWDGLVRSVPSGRVEWNRIDLNTGDFVQEGFATRPYGHISPVTYCRLLLPDLLPKSVEKVLYLDCDLIVCDDLAPLWDIDIAHVDLAAAPELDLAGRRMLSDRLIHDYRSLGITAERPVFNVGVMLVNLVRWRDKRIPERAFACLRCLGPDSQWYDQDALNIVVNGDFLAIEPRWNVRPLLRRRRSAASWEASIVHYFTARKPWQWDYRGSHREQFFQNLDRTVWAGWRPVRPRLAAARALGERARRFVHKSRDRLLRWGRLLRRRYGYPLIPMPRIMGSPVPRRRPRTGEIRLFLALPPDFAPGRLRPLLLSYRNASVDRAFVVYSSDLADPEAHDSGFPVHGFSSDGRRTDRALRQLLDRYGEGFWCVLGTSSGPPIGEDGCLVNFREWSTQLDREGLEAGEARTGSAPTSRIELVGRDLRSGRLFKGSALVERAERAWKPPAFSSRLVLLRYRKSMLLDPGMSLVAGARLSSRVLRITPRSSAATPSDGPRAGSREQRS